MPNLKTSQLAYADTLDGSELVAVVQNSQSVQTTTYAIGNISNNLPQVHIGRGSEAYGTYAIAIGYNAAAFTIGPYGPGGQMAVGARSTALGGGCTGIGYYAGSFGYLNTAIGNQAYASSVGSFACGDHSVARNNYAIAIGAYAEAGHYGQASIAIGAYSLADAEQSIAIGYRASAQSGATYSVVIGPQAGSYADNTVTIGYRSRGYGTRSIAIGHRATTEGGYAVAIGSRSYASYNYCTAVGSYSQATTIGATAIGSYTRAWGDYSTAFGCGAGAYSPYSVALGYGAIAADNFAVAIGSYSFADQRSSVVLGSGTHDITTGSLVVCGYPNNVMLNPVDHYQKFIASTVPDSSATSASLSGDGFECTIIAPPGAAGNNYTFSVVDPGRDSLNVTLEAHFDGGPFVITLGTDGSGDLDNTQNTIANVAALFPVSGFTFEFTGDPSGIMQLFGGSLSGGADGNPTVAMTADGNAPVPGNRPEMWPGALATLTGHVTGCVTDLFGSGGDTATFVLTPLLLYRKFDSTYIFVNEPTFTLESSTEGASGWDVPGLFRENSNTSLALVVTNSVTSVNWMAHLKFEAST